MTVQEPGTTVVVLYYRRYRTYCTVPYYDSTCTGTGSSGTCTSTAVRAVPGARVRVMSDDPGCGSETGESAASVSMRYSLYCIDFRMDMEFSRITQRSCPRDETHCIDF